MIVKKLLAKQNVYSWVLKHHFHRQLCSAHWPMIIIDWDYPASRGPSIFLDKSGRGRDLCQPPRLSLICRSSTETDESVRFETSFYRFFSVRMCCVRNCWLNTRPRYVRYACEVHNNGGFSFEGCLIKPWKVNTHGISNLTQHQSKALLNFLCGKYSLVCLPTGHGKSIIKRIGVAVAFGPNFTSGLSGNRCEGLRECALQCLFLWRNDIYFGQRRDKQTATETIICRLAAGNFEDETVSVQNLIGFTSL